MNKLPFLLRNPKIITRYESQTDPALGCAPQDRSIEQALQYSFININKPKGPTSHQVAEYVKRIVKAKKAGHGGTLDPAVTGVLPVGLNEAVRVVQTFLLTGKEYVCYMKLHGDVTDEQLQEAFSKFTGEIKQLPPLKSAVKREWRTRKIYYLELLERDGTDVLFRVGCQAGTYIRKLCTDMGEYIGTGAHMQQLVRTHSGTFSYENAVTLQDLADAMEYSKQGNQDPLRKVLTPIEQAIAHLPRTWITDAAVASVVNGAPLALPGVVKFEDDIQKDAMIALLSLKGELVALGIAQMDAQTVQTEQKGIVAKLERVVMESSVYAAAKMKKDLI